MRIEVPEGSLYFWCYTQGLRHVGLEELSSAVRCAGKELRPKDIQNYWNGWYRSDMDNRDVFTLSHKVVSASSDYFTTEYFEYPDHPYVGYPEIENRWVPCNKENKPMIKWGEGCMSKSDAMAWPGQKYLAENTKGTKLLIIDCDGDHSEELDFRTIARLSYYMDKTHCLMKPKLICEYEGCEEYIADLPASFHLTFTTDKVVPTMHFPYASIDIIGNKHNSLRYWKNKKWNGLDPIPMTSEIWNDIRRYIEGRKTNG